MMKKTSFLVVFFVLALSSLAAQQKYALVIGNGAYKNLTPLNNPVNDANDMKAALQGLGFTVDTVVNGSLVNMEDAVERFKNRLSVSRNSYGFLFYAGHGVQSGGVNYLIPVDANIRSEFYLRERAVSVQVMLDEINQAGNELNIVVLDACRNNPFSWARSRTRGLQVVSNQPADSIIVYATSAGSTAEDSEGRNGLFTGQLLKNLKTPGLEVNEIFRLTGGDVARISGGRQRPAVYNQFYGIAYFPSVKPSAPTVTVDAKTYYDRGLAYANKGEYDRAIADFTEAIRLDPALSAAYILRGRALRASVSRITSVGENFSFIITTYTGGSITSAQQQAYDKAIADFTQAIRLDLNSSIAYRERGVLYDYKGDYDQAMADYNQAIRLNPNYALAYNNRGIAYKAKGEYDRAIADFTQAIRLDPNYALAYNNRGNVYNDNKGEYDRAIADYTQAIRLDPNDAYAYNNRGIAYYNKKEYDRAIAEYTQAIRLDPNDAMAYYNRGIAYKAKGEYDRAIADYTEAIRLDPNDAYAYNDRGVAYYNKKDYNRAIADYEAALRIDPNYTYAKNNLEKARKARGY
jgi:tetratricopeptide (TPR) repeat protein